MQSPVLGKAPASLELIEHRVDFPSREAFLNVSARSSFLTFRKKLALLALLLSAGLFLIFTCQVIFLKLIGSLILGALFAHSVELQHECLHQASVKESGLNSLIGFLLGLPMLVSYSHYRAVHIRHHRFLGTPQDTEFFDFDRRTCSSFYRILIRAFSLRRYFAVAKRISLSFSLSSSFDKFEREREKIRREYCLFGLVLILTVFLTIATRSLNLVFIWIIPALFVAEPVHFFIELPEHFGCCKDSRNAFENTRSIDGGWFSFWFTNGNNFHIEHHLYPELPVSELPRVHRELKSSRLLPHSDRTYFQFLKSTISRQERVADSNG